MKYNRIFAKGTIGHLQLKNRIVMPAIATFHAQSSGEASDELIRFYEERARGSAGLIITELAKIDNENGVAMPNQLSLTDFSVIPRLRKLTRAVQRHDSKIFIQIHHPGRQGFGMLQPTGELVAPSPTNSPHGEPARELTVEEIGGLVAKFAQGAKTAMIAGADGVEIHAAHGYLISQFLSPNINTRTDDYGGSLENRMRFLSEIYTAIRQTCGPHLAICVRINGDDFVEGGLQLPEAIEVAKALDAMGVDVINVSSGTHESSNQTIEPISYPQGWKTNLAASIKKEVNAPVIGCNVIRKPDFAESLLAEEAVDFIAIGRGLLADPDWGIKAFEGREQEIRPCISCLCCIETLTQFNPLRCAVNARMGRELEYDRLEKNGQARPVAVIGGGPAGMEAARILALREFKPVLFESKDVLGGTVYLGAKPPLKEKLSWFLNNLEYQIRQLHVDIRLGSEATPEAIKAIDPYAIFVATGSHPIFPGIDGANGADGDNVMTVIDVLENKEKIEGKEIVIVGSGMSGLEVAEMLAENGNTVSVIEMEDTIGPTVYPANLFDVTHRLSEQNVAMLPSTKLAEIKSDSVVLLNTTDETESEKPCDLVVLAIGAVPNNALAEQLEEITPTRVKVLGDATRPRTILEAIQDGYEKAYVLF